MARLYLVRHGTHDFVGKALVGRRPGVTLSAEGSAQATRLARFFEGIDGIGAVLSSPMERCQQTAAPLAERLGLTVETSAALNELDCGEWTGLSFETLADDPRWLAWNAERASAAIPGGETADAVRARVMPLLADAAGRDGAAVWVTHADVIKTTVLSLLHAPLDGYDRLEVEPASVTTLDLWPGGGKVVRSNQSAAT